LPRIVENKIPHIITGEMKKFIFRSELWVTQFTGIRVDTLHDFQRAILDVDDDTLYYHLFRNMFDYHFLIPTYSNSFAYWFSENGLFILAERFSIIDPLVYTSLDDVRREIIGILADAGEERRRFKTPFYFRRAVRDVVELGMEARDIGSFVAGFESSGIYSLFYHLVTARLRLGEPTNDYSKWLRTVGQEKIAGRIEALNPWMFNFYDIKRFILDIIRSGSAQPYGTC